MRKIIVHVCLCVCVCKDVGCVCVFKSLLKISPTFAIVLQMYINVTDDYERGVGIFLNNVITWKTTHN